MADNIYKQAFIERESRKRAWHVKGTVFAADAYLEPSEGCVQIGADVEYVTEPHFMTIKGKQIETGKFDIGRAPHGDRPAEYIGTVSKDYHVLQNMDICRAFDAASAYYPLETMGLLNNDRFFFSLKAENTSVKSGDMVDPLETYFFVTDSKSAGEAAIVGSGATRPVCENTLDIAIEAARFLLPIWHDAAAAEMVKHVGDMLAKLAAARQGMVGGFQWLADREFTIEQAVAAFSVAFQVPGENKSVAAFKKLGAGDLERGLVDASEIIQGRLALAESNNKYQVARALGLQQTAMISLENMVKTGYGLNGWTVYNAVSETEQHRANSRGDVAGDLLFGTRKNNLNRLTEHLFKVGI